MTLFHNTTTSIQMLAHESVSVALVSNGQKTLHVAVKLYYDDNLQMIVPYTAFQITVNGILESFPDIEMAVDRYNEL